MLLILDYPTCDVMLLIGASLSEPHRSEYNGEKCLSSYVRTVRYGTVRPSCTCVLVR